MTGKGFEATAMVLSLFVFCASYALIAWKDRSWVNWATLSFIVTVGTRYIFQFFYLYEVEPGGSRYAYFLCYATLALSMLIGALVYAFVKPLTLKDSLRANQDVGIFPWVSLSIGFILYLPILIQFRDYLSEPRHIYEMTRTGYGLSYYGSTTFITLGFITYLFKQRKSLIGIVVFYGTCIVLTYLHGSKGLFLNYMGIFILYLVYVRRKKVGAFATAGVFVALAGVPLGLYAFFGNAADLGEVMTSVATYADYVRHAMQVIDDPNGARYYGEIEMGNVIYSRVPRALMPSKPKDFGAFLLGKKYNPENYRLDEGTGSFDTVGVVYADFGSWALIVICISSGFMSWIARTMVVHVRRSASLGGFIMLLFLAGVSVIPVVDPSYIFETSLLAWILSATTRFHLLRGAPWPARPGRSQAALR